MSKLSLLKISGRWFIDGEGRKVILRGVNLGGSTKVPYKPDGATQNKENWPPIDLKNVSWIGRPFPREEAEEHFTRLKSWGFNCLRFLTTWEAIEHAGPYQYDEEYLDYYADMVAMAGSYGFYVFVDPHQDVWSRVTGGDGAPLWLFDKIGLDYTKFDEAEMAINMQYLYDPKNKKSYPQMVWGNNYKYFTNGTMWTLFFAGRDFAPKLMLMDEQTGEKLNVQDYILAHYTGSLKQIAKRIKDMPHVFGFDSLNEPHHGFIGQKAITRNLKMKKNKKDDPPLPGLAWTPVDGMFAAAGNSFELEEIGLIIWKLTLGVKRKITVNPKKVSIWKKGAKDFWKDHGVWVEGADGMPVAPNDDYFRVVNGQEVNYTRDYLFPFASRVAEEIRQYNPNWMILVEDEPATTLIPPEEGLPENTPSNMVNGFHWYDPALSYVKRFLWPLSVDISRIRPVWGLRGIQKMYIRQLNIQPELSKTINDGNCPCLVGEFGCHMDLNNGKSYKKWKKGQRDWNVFKWQTIALDLMYNAFDKLFLSGTLWNYTADNNNAFGDNWNQEDLSIFSRDQQTVDWQEDINSGGRAISGFCRPYTRRIAGTPLKVQFNRKKGTFRFEFTPDATISAPTEVYIPPIQSPNGYDVECIGAEWTVAQDEPLLFISNPTMQTVTLLLTRKK
ncbi:MAG TPA: cellulase family glycosylhydrolase [Candidatus Deferrimicrobium sp.]|nr:cellulase family glycosylhydrolase [Candidatus Deferrimicrobium sp.]